MNFNLIIRKSFTSIKKQLKKFLDVHDIRDLEIGEKLKSHSQYGEDIVIGYILRNIKRGIYVDVGANHPVTLNNTFLLHKSGWSGINIEPQVNLARAFNEFRPNDINLNIGVSESEGSLTFYEMSMDTLSSFDRFAAINGGKIHGAHLVRELPIPVLPLSTIFDKYLNDESIDFLSVDVEGFDLNVLKSNDWYKYRPKVVMIEINQDRSRIIKFMESIGYDMAYDNKTNGIFIERNFEF